LSQLCGGFFVLEIEKECMFLVADPMKHMQQGLSTWASFRSW